MLVIDQAREIIHHNKSNNNHILTGGDGPIAALADLQMLLCSGLKYSYDRKTCLSKSDV